MRTEKTLSVTAKWYWLDVHKCPLDVWESAYDVGYSSLRKKNHPTNRLIYRFKQRLFSPFTPKSLKAKKRDRMAEMDYEAWNILFSTFVEKVGLDEDFKTWITLRKRLIDVQYKYLKSEVIREGVKIRDRKILNEIMRIELEIRRYEKTGTSKGLTIDDMLSLLSRMQGYRERKENITVLTYFGLIKQFEQWQKV